MTVHDAHDDLEPDDAEMAPDARCGQRTRRNGDPRKRYCMSRRPSAKHSHDHWVNYRTEAYMGAIEAWLEGDADNTVYFATEHDTALEVLWAQGHCYDYRRFRDVRDMAEQDRAMGPYFIDAARLYETRRGGQLRLLEVG